MCDKAVDDFLYALKFVTDSFASNKMIKELFTALYAKENILYLNEGSSSVIFSCNEIDILNMNLNDINLDNIN